MIRDVVIDSSPLRPGGTTILRNNGNEPVRVAIRCFVTDPPPPGYKPCASCGSIEVSSGQTIDVLADEQSFRNAQGYLEIRIRDVAGNTQVIEVPVAEAEGEAGPTMAGF